jgi:hypothetical protein
MRFSWPVFLLSLRPLKPEDERITLVCELCQRTKTVDRIDWERNKKEFAIYISYVRSTLPPRPWWSLGAPVLKRWLSRSGILNYRKGAVILRSLPWSAWANAELGC